MITIIDTVPESSMKSAMTSAMTSATTAALETVEVDLYRDVHKGIRNELFSLTSRIGNLDPADVDTASTIADRTNWFFELLHAHAAHEDEFIAPELASVAPRLDERVRIEHAQLEQQMAAIDRLQSTARTTRGDDARQLATRRWYLAVASFTSSYLAHEATEELSVMPTLNNAIGASRLSELEGVIIASITPEHFGGYLSLILPAANPIERATLVGGIRASAPPEVFTEVIGLADLVLAPNDLQRLLRDLGQASGPAVPVVSPIQKGSGNVV